MSLAFYKVTALPKQLAANGMYFVTSANSQLMEVYMANSTGTAARKVLGEAELNAAIQAYDEQGASKLAAAFNLAVGGAATGNVDIDGSGNVTLSLTLADSGVQANEYAVVTVNAKGIVTGGRDLTAADLPAEITSNTSGKAATAGTADQVANALTING
ncbi:hypothetical protein ACPF8X_40155, partial [Streptomyces sp. G35A]